MELVDKKINDELNKELEANESKLTHIKKAIYGDKTGKIKTFAIISADNPMGESVNSIENNISRKRMKGYLGRGLGKEKFKSTLQEDINTFYKRGNMVIENKVFLFLI